MTLSIKTSPLARSKRLNPPANAASEFSLNALEQRKLFSIATADIVSALSTGAQALHNQMPALVQNAFGNDLRNQTPLVRDSLTDILPDLTRYTPTVGAKTSVDQALSQFRGDGWVVDSTDLSAQGGKVVTLHLDRTLGTGQYASLHSAGMNGWKYLDDANAGLDGRLSIRSGTLATHLTAGVAVVNGKPTFYVGDDSVLTLKVNGDAKLTGTFAKGVLAKVNSTVNVGVDLTAAARFSDAVGPHDGLIVTDDLNRHAGLIIKGTVDGTVTDSALFSASIDGVPVSWGGHSVTTLSRSAGSSYSKLDIDDDAVARSVADGLFRVSHRIPWLDGLGQLLDAKIPVIGKTVDQQLHIREKLGNAILLGVGPSFDGLSWQNVDARLASVGVTTNLNPTSILSMVNGQNVDLLTYQAKGQVATDFPIKPIPLGDWPILGGLADVQASATFGAGLTAGWDLKIGLASRGYYVGEGSKLTAGGEVNAGIEGSLTAFGIPGVLVAGGKAGLRLSADVTFTDPNHDGRAYLSDIGSTATDYARNLSVDGHLDVTGTLYSKALKNPLHKLGIGPEYIVKVSKEWKLFNLVNYHIGPPAA